MPKKLLALCVLFTAFLHVHAQENLSRKPGQLKANVSILGLGASYELRLLKYSTLNLEAGVDMGVSYSNGAYSGTSFDYAIFPSFSGEFRQYYGIARRAARNKSTDNNAGNFFSLTVGYQATPIYSTIYYNNGSSFIIPAWGMQRSWGRHFSFEARFGMQFIPNGGFDNYAYPSARIGFGYVIL